MYTVVGAFPGAINGQVPSGCVAKTAYTDPKGILLLGII